MNISRNLICKLPNEIGRLLSLRRLDISYNNLKSPTDAVSNLLNLCVLQMDACHVTSLPVGLQKLNKLESVSAGVCSRAPKLVDIKENGFRSLRHIKIESVRDLIVSNQLSNLCSLEILNIQGCMNADFTGIQDFRTLRDKHK